QHHRHDLFYGQEALSRICHLFITFLFTCPDHPPTPLATMPRLVYHISSLTPSITPNSTKPSLTPLSSSSSNPKSLSGHRLFISAIMIASKVICDDAYSNKPWSIV
ncbi:hypothetical protein BDN72DRAFT_938201, partial [Pluteus cervinus]